MWLSVKNVADILKLNFNTDLHSFFFFFLESTLISTWKFVKNAEIYYILLIAFYGLDMALTVSMCDILAYPRDRTADVDDSAEEEALCKQGVRSQVVISCTDLVTHVMSESAVVCARSEDMTCSSLPIFL